MTTSTISPRTREMSVKIRPLLTANAGTIVGPNDLNEKYLAEGDSGLDLATVVRTQEHRQEFQAAVKVAVGELGMEILDQDEIKQLSFVTPVGNDSFEMVMTRSGDETDILSGFNVVDHNSELMAAREHLVAMARKSAAA